MIIAQQIIGKWVVAIKANRITVVGAGTTGYSLALAYAWKGYSVVLYDLEESVLAKARKRIKLAAILLEKEGVIGEGGRREIAERILTTTEAKIAYSEPDFLLEAVYEDQSVKTEVFRQADRLCPAHTIFMSNTSYLNIFQFDAVSAKREKNLLITHWFTPPHIIPLVEVVAGENTSSEALAAVLASLKGIGKTPVLLKKYLPGFIVNRIQYMVSAEMFWLVDNGYADVEDIDRAVKASLAVRMPTVGVLQSFDFTGLDTLQQIRSATKLVPQWTPGVPEIIKERVKKGEYGVKTGRGIYDYGDSTPEEVMESRDANYLAVLECFNQLKPLNR